MCEIISIHSQSLAILRKFAFKLRMKLYAKKSHALDFNFFVAILLLK